MISSESGVELLEKSPTGITGLDEITGGGLPQGRPTLICGGPGSGKTLVGIEFLVKGAMKFDEPGVFMAFEETAEELTRNLRSLGFDLEQQKLAVDFVYVERSEIEETGEYDMEALFIRLGDAIDSIGAKRVVRDTLETLFSALTNTAILRAELRRLFRWLKQKGVTAIITAERGQEALTRHGLEEYVSDCVIVLDHRVTAQVATRRLRVVKYRGSSHGTNEYPFLTIKGGSTCSRSRRSASITSPATSASRPGWSGSTPCWGVRATTGAAACSSPARRGPARAASPSPSSMPPAAGESAVYFAFEESRSQIVRNMRSIGIDLEPHLQKGLLQFHASRPTMQGLDTHLAIINDS